MELVVYDANVLYPSTLRDMLIRVGIAGLAQPKWTAKILDEVFVNLQRNRPDLSLERLTRTRILMNASLRDVEVTGHERWVDQFALPDPGDRHVLAAAIESGAPVIVTKNLSDFPDVALQVWGVRAIGPDEFLVGLQAGHPRTLARIVCDIARAWRAPHATPAAVLEALARDAPTVAARLAQSISK
ncbi:MAG: PIN domain-containing protein [Bifidobacteriaceae bacterium]|jgi:predicted nucleic acid-binding protein|nr:PIN domain-containing protein [Bifidobacteriaceae bacterium]